MSSFILCGDCGLSIPRKGPSHKYCQPCSDRRDVETKRRWQNKNPQVFTPERAAWAKERVSKSREFGIQKSAEQAKKLSGTLPDLTGAEWYVRFSVPFMPAVSKNYIWGFSGKGKGHVYKRQESKQYRDSIALTVKRAVSEMNVVNAKVWLDFHVQKPTHRSDAINVVDLICDAVKDGLGVDDRWFAIRKLDWEIVKKNPQIFIGISQEAAEDFQACSFCGGLLPLSMFGKKSGNKNGKNRVCKACVNSKNKTVDDAEAA